MLSLQHLIFFSVGADSTGAAGKLPRYPRKNRGKSFCPGTILPPICNQMLINHSKLHNCIFASVVLMLVYHNAKSQIVTYLLSAHCLLLYFLRRAVLMPFGALGPCADGAHCRGSKGVEEVWGSVVSSPSGVHGRIPAKNGFGTFLA